MPIHSLILLPGDKINIYCTDGMLPDSVSHVKEWFNFGNSLTGENNIKFQNCGPENVYVGLYLAVNTMEEKWVFGDDPNKDYENAWVADSLAISTF